MLAFHNVSLFQGTEYGFQYLNFDTRYVKKNAFICRSEENAKLLSWLIEGKIEPQSGYIIRSEQGLIQNDKWWLSLEKIIYQNVDQWLKLDDHAYVDFDRIKKSKFFVIEKLQARSILYLPVYRLRNKERIQFTLLSLTFQSQGGIILIDLPKLELDEPLLSAYNNLFKMDNLTLFFIVTKNDINKIPNDFNVIDLTN